MPRNRSHIKRERDNPHPDIDDYRHRPHHDRSRSPRRSPPRDKVDKGKGKGKVKREQEEEEEKEEKKVLVRKRVKEGEYTPKLNYPEWLLWVAGAAISREDRKKHTYSLEKRGGSGASSGEDKGKGKGNDREHIGKKEDLEEEKWGHGHGHQGGQSRDDDNDDDDDGYRNEAERLDDKMEELMKLPHHVLEDMREEEEEARHDEMLKPNYRRRKYGVAKRDWNNDQRETVYERYMPSLREDP
ncbi:hypothetical protein NEUTE1DRAFT_103280 [Neurospora tetrasperma FGSC 2508]|uniref:Uncharacterized protein n=1 Tax=Neurospora tetrasperma (strain FGSC 2508 / ATCC MYA-4615 / P0657) TaxID=510951 RepID=F8MSE1_NEUT8|nr:uncharacterized protein NEUTE1DRAFT_103280 [Neurospora tetrasperma FGSC 2508]EGO55881.1 hypothetical protein NEUTE1DRAFT_103280 [Neurospora tetrasperma FGSC 2508]EGZ68862.1 hypothetical protein NEUTE2DRAFT_72051 [Neurospora tetrasperma FGSC 2509]